MENLGERIAALRKKQNMTQAELGEKLNLSAQAVSKWENNLSEPDLQTLQRMTELFGITVNELLTGEPDTASDTAQEADPTEEAAAAAEPREEKKMLGVCTKCGKMLYEGDEGATYPVLKCRACVEREKAAQYAAEQAEKARADALRAKKRRRKIIGFIVGALAMAAVILMLLLWIDLRELFHWGTAGYVAGTVIFAFAVGAAAAEMIWENCEAVWDVLEWGFTRTVQFPGIIFEWDLDGLKFLFFMKILFAVLGFLVGVLFAVLGIFAAAVVAIFTFPFCAFREPDID